MFNKDGSARQQTQFFSFTLECLSISSEGKHTSSRIRGIKYLWDSNQNSDSKVFLLDEKQKFEPWRTLKIQFSFRFSIQTTCWPRNNHKRTEILCNDCSCTFLLSWICKWAIEHTSTLHDRLNSNRFPSSHKIKFRHWRRQDHKF
jgi:hypothetical protein